MTRDVVGRRRHGGAADGVQQAALHPHLLGPTGDAAIEVLRLTFSTDGFGNRQGEEERWPAGRPGADG